MTWGPSGSSGPAHRRRVLVALLAACLATGLARAQSTRFVPQGQGLSWGPVTVRPTLIFNYGFDDNIFYASQDLAAEQVLGSREGQLRPGITFDCPFGGSYLRGGYSALFRNYATDQYSPTTQWSHFFDLEGHLRFGPRAYANLRDRFVRGTEELQEVDPGGELAFGDVPFRNHTPSVEVGTELTPRQGASVVWNYNSSQFVDDQGIGFFNYRGHGFQARYNYRFGPDTLSYLYVGTDTTKQNRDQEVIQYDGHGAGFSITQTLNRAVSATATVGYQVLDASGSVDSAYHGPSLSGSASWLSGDAMRITFNVRRFPYQSFFVNNAYYLNRALLVELLRQVGIGAYWRLETGFEQNTYSDELDVTGLEGVYCGNDGGGTVCPSSGVRRRDKAWRAEAGFGSQLSRVARWYVGYNWQSRSTNLLQADPQGGFGDPFAYDVNRYFFRIEVGWL